MAQYFVNPDKAVWAATTAFALNSYVCPTTGYATAAAKRFVYEATSIGSSPNQTGASEPTWPTTVGNTVVDGDITWTCRNCDTWEKATKYAEHLAIGSGSTAFSAGDQVVFKYDSAAASSPSASLSFVGANASFINPTRYISAIADTGTTITFAKATAAVIANSGSSNNITFSNGAALLGLMISSDGAIYPNSDNEEIVVAYDCTFKPGDNKSVQTGGSSSRKLFFNCTYDMAKDTATASASCHYAVYSYDEIRAPILLNAGFRGGFAYGSARVFGLDASAFSSIKKLGVIAAFCRRGGEITIPEIYSDQGGALVSNLTAHNWNCPAADTGIGLYYTDIEYGLYWSATDNVRTGGAELDGVPFALKVYVGSGTHASEWFPAYSPWAYETISSVGTKTLTVCIQNASEELDDTEIWLEAEYLGTSGKDVWSFTSNRRANGTKTFVSHTQAATAHPSDSSTWTTNLTYRQKMELSLPILRAGLMRWRVAFAKTNWNQTTQKLHIDWKGVIS